LSSDHDQEILELEESARTQRFAGHVLMAAGAITAVTGIGLLIAGTMSGTCVSGNDPHHASYDCGDSWMGFAGALTLFLGLTAFGPGAALHDSSERDLATARSLRRTSTRPWSLAPKVDPHGAAAQFAVAF
jgi:hypothetical protein